MKRQSDFFPVKLAKTLFFLNAGIWLLFGTWSLVRLADQTTAGSLAPIAVLMFGNAAAMLVCGLGIGRRKRWFYLLAVALLLFNIILSVTDQFGLFDLVTMLLDLLLLALLIINRPAFLPLSRETNRGVA